MSSANLRKGNSLWFNDDFATHYQALNEQNVASWLLASASIPGVMSAIRDIPDAPVGSYRDGGLIDYHLDLPFQSQGIVLYPHFTDSITPGWFDKMLKNRKANPGKSGSYTFTITFGRILE